MNNNENEIKQNERIIGIYKITSPSGKIYIGQSINIKDRWYKYTVKNCKSQIRLYYSFNKYNVESHQFEVIELCSIEQLDELEIHWKQHYINQLGWSQMLFCELYDTGGGPKSEETKRKIGIGNLNKPKPGVTKALTGRAKPKGFGDKISKALKGTTQSQETKDKKSLSMKGKPKPTLKKGKDHANYGKRRTEEHKIKMSKIMKGKPILKNARPILQYDLEGNFIREWESTIAAEAFYKVRGIHNVIGGLAKTAGGFKWVKK